jgi:hypothetical protein
MRTRKLPILLREHCIWIILIVAFILRWDGMTKSLWIDELVSLREIFTPASAEIFQRLGTTPWALLTSNLLLRLSDLMMLTGELRMVRLPMVLIGMTAIWLAWKTGKEFGDWPTGLLFAMLLAVWPYKAFNDNIIRYYTIMITFAVAMLYVWERFRRRRSLRSYIIAIVVSFFALLTQPVSFTLILFPCIYTAWWFLSQIVQAIRNRSWSSRNKWLDAICMITLLIPFLIVQLQLNRTPDFLLDISEQVSLLHKSNRPRLSQIAISKIETRHPELLIDPTSKLKKSRLPSIASLIIAGREALRLGLNPETPNPTYLWSLEKYPGFFWICFPNWKANQWLPPKPWVALAVVLAYILGLVFLGFASFPLMLSCLMTIVLTGVLLKFNEHSFSGLNPRYYVILGALQALIFSAALGFCLLLIRKAVMKASKRFYCMVLTPAIVGLSLLIFFPFAKVTSANARLAYTNFSPFYQSTREKFPYGVAFLGCESAYNGFYNDLAILKEGNSIDDWWRSPRRNQVFDIFPQAMNSDFLYWIRNEILLEQFNCMQAIISYRNVTYMQFHPLDDKFLRLLPAVHNDKLTWGDAMHYELGHTMFLTRGRSSEILSPRLVADSNKHNHSSTTYRMQAYFETPGLYTMRAYEPSGTHLISLKIDSNEIPFTRKALSTSSLQHLGSREIQLRDMRLHHPPPLSETMRRNVEQHNHWIKNESNWSVLDDRTTAVCEAKFTTPSIPWKLQQIDLEYAGVSTDHSPLVVWQGIFNKWNPLTKISSVGELNIRIRDYNCEFSLPVRIDAEMSTFTYHRLIIFDSNGKNKIFEGETHWLNPPGRTLRPGDILCLSGSIPESVARKEAGKVMSVVIETGETSHVNLGGAAPAELSSEANFLSPGVARVYFIKFILENNQLMIGIGVPKGKL